MSSLVIVESPAKATTIKKYLGDGYQVMASMGHVRDLPVSRLGVDPEHNFKVNYEPIKGKKELISKLKSAAKASDKVYLATDPDREGEAISWHLAELLGVDPAQKNRVTFNEITKTGVQQGMAHPRQIDMQLVDAQQARRVLDRIVGYKISPFLWKKVRKGLSAGRVQSVAVRLVVDREEEIRAFHPEEYWSIEAELSKQPGKHKPFEAHFYGTDGKKTDLKNGEQAKVIVDEIGKQPFVVSQIKKGTRQRQPYPPFTTSTLQQEASRRFGFQAKRTMKIAQELYEGVNVAGMGATGLITYMRTDSLRISAEALDAAGAFVTKQFGESYALPKPRVYKSRAGAQDAHEAIRPTVISLTPAAVKPSLTVDQFKLYKMIWERFIATQMANCRMDTVAVDIAAGRQLFKASGFTVKFDGFTHLYVDSADAEEQKNALPELSEGETLRLDALTPNQHFTQPPQRYTEASLIKELEENGIGRPSTYAPTLTTIQQRGYVERDGKALKPTAAGEVTTKLMKEQFSDIVDVGFTAGMEKTLDSVEEGKTDWIKAMDAFYTNFSKTLQTAETNMEGKKMKIPDEETDIICDKCGRKMVVKQSRYGKFLGCSGFPECRNTKPLAVETPGVCPVCGKRVLSKKTRTGRTYFGCEDNPKCGFMTWDTPTKDRCPQCGSTLFRSSGRLRRLHCLKEGCGYERPLPVRGEKDDKDEKGGTDE